MTKPARQDKPAGPVKVTLQKVARVTVDGKPDRRLPGFSFETDATYADFLVKFGFARYN